MLSESPYTRFDSARESQSDTENDNKDDRSSAISAQRCHTWGPTGSRSDGGSSYTYTRFDSAGESQSDNEDDNNDELWSAISFQTCRRRLTDSSSDDGGSYKTAQSQLTEDDNTFARILPLIKEIAGSNIPWAMYVFCLSAAFFITIYIINKQERESPVAEIILIIFMFTGCYGQTLCLLKKRNQHFVTFIPLEGRHSNHYLMAGVYVFGSGALLSVMVRLHMYFHAATYVYNCQSGILSNKSYIHLHGKDAIGNKTNSSTKQQFIGIFCNTDVIYDCIRMVFTLFQIAFLQSFHTATFAESVRIKFLLYHTMLTNLCIWIRYVVEETHLFGKSKERLFKNIDEPMHRCLEINEILTPFILEYSLIVAGLLHEISCHMKAIPAAARDSIETSGMSSIFVQRSTEQNKACPQRDGSSTQRGSRNEQAVSGSQPGLMIGILSGLLVISSSLSFDQANDLPTTRSFILFTVYEGLFFIIQIVVLIAMFTQLRFHVKHTHQLRPDEFLLFIGLIGTFSFTLIGTYANIVCCRKKLHRGTLYGADIANAAQIVFNMTAQLLQAFVIQFSRRYFPHPDNKKSRESARKIRQLALFLLALNLGIWAQDSFIELRNSAKTSFPCGPVVFESNWDVIVAITYPFAIFYRFHSAAMLFEIWARFKYYHRTE